jgi:hypothetical protein
VTNSEARAKEIKHMLLGKVELEALHCFGPDFCCKFFGSLLKKAKQKKAPGEATWKDAI